jgi:hypothetical protein
MTYEELLEKHKDKDDWKGYINDLWSLPLSELHKVPTITGREKGKCNNCNQECNYKCNKALKE